MDIVVYRAVEIYTECPSTIASMEIYGYLQILATSMAKIGAC